MRFCRKVITYILIVISSFALVNKSVVSGNEIIIDYSDAIGLGFTYNVVKSPFFHRNHFNYANQIFDYEWIKTQIASVPLNDSGQQINIYDNSLLGLKNQLKQEYSKMYYNNNLGDFSGTIRNLYTDVILVDGDQYLSNYNQFLSISSKTKRYWLTSFFVNKEYYQPHLSDVFINSIKELDEKIKQGIITQEDYFKFFDIYGTHIIVDIIYGYKLDVAYSVLTNGTTFDDTTMFLLKSELTNYINSVFGGDKNVQFDVSKYMQNGIYRENFEAIAYDGINDTNYLDLYAFARDFMRWDSSNSEGAPIMPSPDGLSEIWNIIPDDYAVVKEYLAQNFDNYNNYYNNYIEYNKAFIGPNEVQYKDIYTRQEEIVITDSGRFNQACDEIDLSYIPNINNLKKKGYNKVEVKIKLEVKENHDGYQGIILYPNSGNVGKNNYLGFTELKHGGRGKDKNFTHYSIVYTLDINDITNEGLLIRYGARGLFDDDWVNRNVSVDIKFIK